MRIDKPDLRTATAQFIALLVRSARFEMPNDYQPVVSFALEWGFEKSYGQNWQGDEDIRDGLVEATKGRTLQRTKSFQKALWNSWKPKQLPSLPRWYLHELRPLVMSLQQIATAEIKADDLASSTTKSMWQATE